MTRRYVIKLLLLLLPPYGFSFPLLRHTICLVVLQRCLIRFCCCFSFCDRAGFPFGAGMETGSFASHDGFSHAGICSGKSQTIIIIFSPPSSSSFSFLSLSYAFRRRRCRYARHFPPSNWWIRIDSTAPFSFPVVFLFSSSRGPQPVPKKRGRRD